MFIILVNRLIFGLILIGLRTLGYKQKYKQKRLVAASLLPDDIFLAGTGLSGCRLQSLCFI